MPGRRKAGSEKRGLEGRDGLGSQELPHGTSGQAPSLQGDFRREVPSAPTNQGAWWTVSRARGCRPTTGSWFWRLAARRPPSRASPGAG
eukprot:15441738-Alexandrium_andersonii.AAC.1